MAGESEERVALALRVLAKIEERMAYLAPMAGRDTWREATGDNYDLHKRAQAEWEALYEVLP
jgi:hypothetical protein